VKYGYGEKYSTRWAEPALSAEKYVLPPKPNRISSIVGNSSTVSPQNARTEALGAFVSTLGGNFVLNGDIKYFSGSNDYFLILR
jgi:mannan endo-1,4-beta-mannosidase